MGMLVEGRWTDSDSHIENGAYVRPSSIFGQELTSEAVTAIAEDPKRFLLIASLSCPWSHRTTLVRQLKGLEAQIPLQIAGGPRVQGYAVDAGAPWTVPGVGARIVHLHQLYTLSDPSYTGRVTVPVLWDARRQRIVSNESAKIIAAFDAASCPPALNYTLRPEDLASDIDQLNDRVQVELSNAVYRAGFAQRQELYDEAVESVFAMLDALEKRLAIQRYLFGSIITEADWRLFPTLVRFDAVYHVLFKCSRRRLVDYPHLWAYARDLYTWEGVAQTVDLSAIRAGYYRYMKDQNPFGIVAALPEVNWSPAHDRMTLGPACVRLRNGRIAEVDPNQLAKTTR